MRPSGLPSALVALTLIATACGGGGGEGADPATSPPAPPATETASVEPGAATTTGPSPNASQNPLFAFEAEQVSGETFDGSSLSGRDVAIWFWAPW